MSRKPICHRSRGDRGAAAVEMALVLPLLLMITFGIIDFGRMYNTQITINQAAREGARTAALGYGEGEVTERVREALPGGATPGADWRLVMTGCEDGPDGPAATVTVEYDFSFVTPFNAVAAMFGDDEDGPDDLALTSKAAMACQS